MNYEFIFFIFVQLVKSSEEPLKWFELWKRRASRFHFYRISRDRKRQAFTEDFELETGRMNELINYYVIE